MHLFNRTVQNNLVCDLGNYRITSNPLICRLHCKYRPLVLVQIPGSALPFERVNNAMDCKVCQELFAIACKIVYSLSHGKEDKGIPLYL